ncbi:MAG: SpoIID/LytB domain-containing protein [Proteobacteria bacterium]|nr:SpoIID/LytB domain-containing protein [Pseudomonadota bacterium]
MKYGLKLIIILSLSLGILDSVSFADPKLREEDDSSPYMLGLSRTDNINSTSTIRVKIFPHEKDYLPQGRDEITDHFTIRSEYPCTIFRADKSVIIAGGLISKGKNNISFRAKDLAEAVIVDCPESFTLERNPNEPKKNFSYSGLVYIHVVKKQEQSSLEAINVVSLRGYLRGVVPSEVYPNWPIETLKTQAVAARTYAVYHLVHARRYVPQRLWDVDDTIMYQAYTGISHRSERTDAAVFATDGQILMCKGQVIQAFYHAESGGSTEEASTVWQQAAPFTVARSEASDVEMSH